ncbi:hypothetical protein MLD38_017406 [Melastoma candidum]|uniref:Uncharacterized protein n=1 Tax=Melastoma candidum TaxID=119954 RepID=A0ACB9QYR4_9MYRT|nr:hypothetical protein MLD38_017406 [Melastoma candidum]
MASESYPPLLRPPVLNHPHLDPKPNPTSQDSSLRIPVIDLEVLDPAALDEACREWGVFHLVNHGVPPSTLAQLRDLAAAVFSLPFETKRESFTSPTSYFWGTPVLTPSGSPLSRSSRGINLLEGMNFPLRQLPSLDSRLPLVASFRDLLLEYGLHMGRIATSLFQAMAKILDLDPEHYSGQLSESTGFIRAYRYPRGLASGSDEDTPGLVAHTDSSVLAILLQNQVNGLEVQKDGVDGWIPVDPVPGALVVNLGDMMQALSDDLYKSVNHRVRSPPPREESDRISICYFVFPGEGYVIRSSKYREFTYEEFQAQVQRDVKTIGEKVGLGRFKKQDAMS